MPDQALSGVKVLDFSHYISGPYCTKLLADFGADVIKVERPGGGDPARKIGPFPGDVPHPEKSGMFLFLNTNKRSTTVNLDTDAGKQIVRQLLKDVDVVVESFRPGTMARFGLDYESVRAVKPEIVYASVSNFGQTGPYRDFKGSEIILYAMGGEMYSSGLEDRYPLMMGPNICLFQGGAAATVGTLGALYAAKDQGLGQHVDISLMETQAGTIDRRMATVLAYHYCGEVQRRTTQSVLGYPMGVYPCADGYFELVGGFVRWPQIVKMLGSPLELRDSAWASMTAQRDPTMQERFDAIFLPWVLERTKKELWEVAEAAGVLSAPLNDMEDALADPYFNQRHLFAQIPHPDAGTFTYPGRPWIMRETPWEVRRPAPRLGEHNVEVLEPLGYTRQDLVQLRAQGVI
ncbi:MAG: CoA transferase [Chloroflexi bacterium]|nr:CoA transferase [Chloroflexota bacterium]